MSVKATEQIMEDKASLESLSSPYPPRSQNMAVKEAAAAAAERSSHHFTSQEFTNLSMLRLKSKSSGLSSSSSLQSMSPQQRTYHPVEALIDFLDDRSSVTSSEPTNPTFRNKNKPLGNLEVLEELTLNLLSGENADPELLRILRGFGWTGSKFRYPDLHTLKAQENCLGALKNFYLRHHKFMMEQDDSLSIHALDKPNKRSAKLDLILPFCPEMLLNYLEEKKIHMLQQSSVKSFAFTGACMLADISGFSKFSGPMCAKGVGGLDGLREATNVFLAHFVKMVYEHNGDGKGTLYESLCVLAEEKHGR